LGAVVGQLALLPPLLLPEEPEDPDDEPEDPEDPDDPDDPEELDAPDELPEEPEDPDDPEDPEEPDEPEDPDEPDDPELASVPPPVELVLPPQPGAIKTSVPTDAATTRKSCCDLIESTSHKAPRDEANHAASSTRRLPFRRNRSGLVRHRRCLAQPRRHLGDGGRDSALAIDRASGR
jgi:hypothetical protein